MRRKYRYVTASMFVLPRASSRSGVASASLAIVGRFAVNISYNIGLQYAAELLPTVVRAQGVALIHIMGYVASIIAPFVVYLVSPPAQKKITKNLKNTSHPSPTGQRLRIPSPSHPRRLGRNRRLPLPLPAGNAGPGAPSNLTGRREVRCRPEDPRLPLHQV